jgi:hypothetical protein
MLDYWESVECAAEQRLDEMTEGQPPGKFKCSCGNVDDLDDAMSASANPYSEPICGKCADEMLKEYAKQEGGK